MKFGVLTPVVQQLPGQHAAWEETAGPDELARIAREVDRLGYHHLTCSDHVAVPETVVAQRGSVYWDPLALFGFVAGITRRVRLVTNVLVLGYRHPLDVAKRYGTLDRLSGGRLVLGFGVGSLQEEFELLGVPFVDRGDRGDDALRAVRASLSRRSPEYHGAFFDYSGFVVEPSALQDHVPFWIGGRTRRSLRRAVELAEGWMPFALSGEQVATLLETVELPEAFEVVLPPSRPLDPLSSPGRIAEEVEALQRAGATVMNVAMVHHSLDHFLEQLVAFAALTGLS